MSYLSETEINNYMKHNKKYFEETEITRFKNIIAESDITISDLNALKLKSPTLGIVLSVALGLFGIDRFYSGNYALGALKLFTFGGSGVWWIIDWFFIGKAVKRSNQSKIYCFLTHTTNSASFDSKVDMAKKLIKSKDFRKTVKDVGQAIKGVTDEFDIYH